MAKSPLPQLIRRARYGVDERRAELAAVVAELDKSNAAIQAHDAIRDAEQQALPDQPVEIMAGFASWSRHHAQARAKLADLNGKLERTRDAAQDALQEAVAELKRLELADEARLVAEKKAEAKKAEAKAEDIELIRRSMRD